MVDVLTPTIRLTEPMLGGDLGSWPTLLNSNLLYTDQAINQTVTVSVADVNYSLVADGTGSDQARYATYNITGAWTADRTITLPANAKIGRVINGTTGGHNVILSAGATTLSVPPGASLLFTVDDSHNVVLQPGWQTINTYTAVNSSGVGMPLSASFRAFRLTTRRASTSTDAVELGVQLSFDGGVTYKNTNNAWGALSVTIGGVIGSNGSGNDSVIPISPGLTNADTNGWDAETTIDRGPNTASLRTVGFGRVGGPTYLFWAGGGTYAGATGTANYMVITRPDSGNFSGTFILEGLA